MHRKTPHFDKLSGSLLEVARGHADQRLVRFTLAGKAYFAKRPERYESLRYWITKGHPLRAFKREVAQLKAFGARKAPVPAIVAEAHDCIVTADHGPTVLALLKQGAVGPEVFSRLGRHLWQLHELGLAHGRPVLRDLCWDDHRVTFLDLEAGAKLNATPRDFARDVLVLLHSILVSKNTTREDGVTFMQAYFTLAGDEVFAATLTRVEKLWWLEMLAYPVMLRHRQRGKKRSEFIAIRTMRQAVLQYAETIAKTQPRLDNETTTPGV